MSGLLEILRPPPHRGPLIAAGAVVLAVGVVLAEVRLGDAVGIAVHVLITGVTAALILGLGLQPAGEGARPPAYQSVLLVTGLLVFEVFLLRLADLLGADFGEGGSGARDTVIWGTLPPGAIVWTSLVLAGVAGWAAFARRSAVALLIAAIAAGLALLAAIAWIFDADSQGPYRFVLLATAPAHAADPVFPTASRIGLVAPAGFTPSSRFAGFENPFASALITVERRSSMNKRMTRIAIAPP